MQDFSAIIVEFNTGIEIKDAKQKVKDAVDKTKKDLPTDPSFIAPSVMEIDLSEIPNLDDRLTHRRAPQWDLGRRHSALDTARRVVLPPK